MIEISFETAQALKDAGLKHEIQKGDWYYWNNKHNGTGTPILLLVCDVDLDILEDGDIFAPTLSQLLGLIEGEGFKKYTLEADGKGGYSILLWTWDDAAAEIDFGDGWIPLVDFHGQSREEAAAQAYLWILRQKGEREAEA